MLQQVDLFEPASKYPAGFRYAPEFISRAEEQRLVDHLQRLEFKPFEFQGFLGKRRVVSFGWRYDFNGGGLHKTDEMPDFLLPLRDRAAAFAGLASTDLQQVLLTEYQPGAPIGWHKDRSVYGDVVGVSLLSACTFRFRRKAGAGWERSSIVLAPRSVYLLHGPARTDWEHSIPPVSELRYSITFRNFRDGSRAPV
jgi:alkylated DNA repair dioxygenase AlkB